MKIYNIQTVARSSVNALRSQRGMTLVELMVSLTIGLIILAALGTLFLNISRSNDELSKVNSQIENGRFAIQLLQDDVVHAGFWGDFVPAFDDLTLENAPGDTPTAIPDVCLAYDAVAWDYAYKTNLIGIPVQVYSDTPPAGGGCADDYAVNRQPNTDVLVVRHADTCVAGVGDCAPFSAGNVYFQSSLSHYPSPDNGDSNCPVGFTADSVPYLLDTVNLDTLTQKDCDTPVTDKRKFISNIYFVRDYASTEGDGIPTLMLAQFDSDGHQQASPLIEGIEAFRVELGIDNLSDTGDAIDYTQPVIWADEDNLTSPTNRGDGAADGAYIRCTDAVPCTVAQLTNVVAVKLYVLARATRPTPGYVDNKTYVLGSTEVDPVDDNFKRHVFSTTVRLNNVSGRRETP